ncbi:MAG: hypothetical protein OEU32_01280 [Acidimicrobiia bacterium]|nr:hypothetical protein [Acidimicrobiia bacterium]
MDDFPTEEWVRRLDDAVRAAGVHGQPLVIVHELTGGAEPFRYLIRVGPDGSTVTVGDAADATVRFRQTVATAREIRSGELAPSEAVLLGRVGVGGDARVLVAHRETLAALDRAMSSVTTGT